MEVHERMLRQSIDRTWASLELGTRELSWNHSPQILRSNCVCSLPLRTEGKRMHRSSTSLESHISFTRTFIREAD